MSRTETIRPEFVELMPKVLSDGVLYISKKYSTASHLCCCGCGTKIVTPLKPGAWRLTVNGQRVSLRPSVGNWSAACQSHYWIQDSKINWAGRFTKAEIDDNRVSDELALERRYAPLGQVRPGFWARVWLAIRKWI